jgi:hypothetical protein
MDTPSHQASLPIAIVFWFLAIVAISFVLLAVWRLWRSALQRPFDVAVETRRVNVLLRNVRLSKPDRTVTRLYGDYQLELVRTDTGRISTQTEKNPLSKEELVSLEFLDRYSPGTRLKAIEERDGSGTLDLEPENRWFGVVGILFGAWMFGTFAWMARPFATGAEDPAKGIILKFLSFAALLVAVVVFVALLDQRTRSGKELQPRVAVEGFARRLTSEEFVAGLRSAGVNVEDRVAQWLGESVRFCEYQYGGKTWRTTSLYCQPPEDQPCPGRLNPDNPRDVKWDREP